jgi:hypothetical protein
VVVDRFSPSAFAYGSGVFLQAGQSWNRNNMADFIIGIDSTLLGLSLALEVVYVFPSEVVDFIDLLFLLSLDFP